MPKGPATDHKGDVTPMPAAPRLHYNRQLQCLTRRSHQSPHRTLLCIQCVDLIRVLNAPYQQLCMLLPRACLPGNPLNGPALALCRSVASPPPRPALLNAYAIH